LFLETSGEAPKPALGDAHISLSLKDSLGASASDLCLTSPAPYCRSNGEINKYGSDETGNFVEWRGAIHNAVQIWHSQSLASIICIRRCHGENTPQTRAILRQRGECYQVVYIIS
jgi:hypothetical protein